MLILSKNEEPGRAASERRTALYRDGSTIWGRTVFHGIQRVLVPKWIAALSRDRFMILDEGQFLEDGGM